MSKPSQKGKKRADDGAFAIGRMIRVSPIKLNFVAALIRGKTVGRALDELTFLRKAVAVDVKKVLQSAVANAENNHNLDIDKLFVSEAFVGKNLVMKRWQSRARGRSGKILKPFSQLTIRVKENKEAL